MEKIKYATQVMIEDVNSEESIIIKAFENWTSWLFKLILFMGLPFFLFVISQFIQ